MVRVFVGVLWNCVFSHWRPLNRFIAGEKKSIVTTRALLQVSAERKLFCLYRSIDVIACTSSLF